jgi:hypothetical protein
MWVFPGPVRNASFFRIALEILMISRADPAAGFGRASSGFPERLAGFPKRVFARNSNVIEHSVVQRTQLLPPTPATKPNLEGIYPARSYTAGFRGRTGAAGFLNK